MSGPNDKGTGAPSASPIQTWAESILPMVIRAAWMQDPKLCERGSTHVLIVAARGSVLAPCFTEQHREIVDMNAPPGAETAYVGSFKGAAVISALRCIAQKNTEKNPEAAAAFTEQADRVEGMLARAAGRDVVVLFGLSRQTAECTITWPEQPIPKMSVAISDVPRVNARGGSA